MMLDLTGATSCALLWAVLQPAPASYSFRALLELLDAAGPSAACQEPPE